MDEKQALKKNDGGMYTLKGSRLWGALLFCVLVLVDQLTKLVADVYFNTAGAPESVDVIPGWIALRLAYNDGIAYGIGGDSPAWVKLAVIALTGVMMVGLAVLYCKIDKRRSWLRTALVFVVAGGIGNLIDRLYYKVWTTTALGVRDMVDLSRFGFAVCNFADFFISAGAVILVLSLLFFDKEALFPLGKKYKALAKEAEEEEERKKAEKEKAAKENANG